MALVEGYLMDSITNLSEYGPIGVVCVIILGLYLRQNKRLQELEDSNESRFRDEIDRCEKRNEEQAKAYKELIKEYVQLVENNTQVIGKLTACVQSFRDTIQEIKNKINPS